MLAPGTKTAASVFVLIGAAAAILGLLPWLITGMHLPLQNLWADDVPPSGMPITLLPFSQYLVELIFAVTVVGSAIAGIVGRATRAKHPRSARDLVAGVAVVQVIGAVQTVITVAMGLRHDNEAKIYLAGIGGGTALSILLGIGVLVLIARAPKAGVVIAGTLAALAFGLWLSWLVHPLGLVVVPEPILYLLGLIYWVPAVLVGLLIVWAGIGSVGRVIAAIGSLLLLWVGTALISGVSMSIGSRALLRDPAEVLGAGWQVFRQSLFSDGGPPTLFLPAVIVAIVGLLARWVLMRRTAKPEG